MRERENGNFSGRFKELFSITKNRECKPKFYVNYQQKIKFSKQNRLK